MYGEEAITKQFRTHGDARGFPSNVKAHEKLTREITEFVVGLDSILDDTRSKALMVANLECASKFAHEALAANNPERNDAWLKESVKVYPSIPRIAAEDMLFEPRPPKLDAMFFNGDPKEALEILAWLNGRGFSSAEYVVQDTERMYIKIITFESYTIRISAGNWILINNHNQRPTIEVHQDDTVYEAYMRLVE